MRRVYGEQMRWRHNTAGVSWSTARTQDHAQGGDIHEERRRKWCAG